jgi:hypothetical protein
MIYQKVSLNQTNRKYTSNYFVENKISLTENILDKFLKDYIGNQNKDIETIQILTH